MADRVESIGIDVTDSVYNRMEKLGNPIWAGELLDVALEGEKDEEERLLIGCALEAAAMHQERYGRGLILQDLMGPMRIWYISQKDQAAGIHRLRSDTRRRLEKAVAAYDPEKEAIIVSLTIEHVYCVQTNLAGLIADEFRHRRKAIPASDKMTFPSGVRFEKSQQYGGFVYEFIHDELGYLGRFVITGYGAAHMRYHIDVAPDPLAHQDYKQKLKLFQDVAVELENKFLYALGVSQGEAGLAHQVEALKLYAAFIDIPNDFEMTQFFLQTTDKQKKQVWQMGNEALPMLSDMDARGVRQRLSELDRMEQSPSDVSQLAQTLYNYLRIEDEFEARAYLLAQADTLLTDEAEELLVDFWGNTPETVVFIEERYALLKHARRVHRR